MNTEITHHAQVPPHVHGTAHAHPFIEVTINRKPVRFRQARATGLEIKTTAIAQSVAIQIDFVLFLLLGPGRRKVIGDEDVVHLDTCSAFEAIPCDDNS
jgi:hypothetical protein